MKKYFDYFLVYLLLAFSVVPFFTEKKTLLVFVTGLLVVLYLLKNKRMIPIIRSYGQILLLITIMYIGQIFTLNIGEFDFNSIFGTYIRFTFPYLVLLTVGSSFISKFIKLNYVLAIVVLVIWMLENIIPQLTPLIRQLSVNLSLDPSNENILIYNSEPHLSPIGLIKNAGYAYEGGAYSVILMLSLIMNYLKSKTLKNKESYVFIIALLTTFSTAGYFSFFIFLFAISLIHKKAKTNRLTFTSVIVLLIMIYLYTNISILSEKINYQFELAQQDEYSTAGRFASAQADIIELGRNPLFGVGKFDDTRFKIFSREGEQHRANGLSDFLAKFGILFFVGYYIIMYKSISIYINKHGITNIVFKNLIILTIALFPFSQAANQWPVYIILLYLSLLHLNSMPSSSENRNSLSL